MPTKRTPSRKRLTPQEYRAQHPDVNDAAFADAISVPEAAEIMKVKMTLVQRLVREGRLAGKILSAKCYIVSRKAAEQNLRDYHERRKQGAAGRPRTGA